MTESTQYEVRAQSYSQVILPLARQERSMLYGRVFVKSDITGKSFSTTLTEQRLLKAHELLRTTASPVNKIMTSVGINNKSFFYTQYKKRFGKTPNSDRL